LFEVFGRPAFPHRPAAFSRGIANTRRTRFEEKAMKAVQHDAGARSSARGTLLHLIVSLHKQSIAIPTEHVREILRTPRVVPLPGAPPHVRGVIDVRGEVLQVVDLRLRLGMPHLTKEIDELVEILRAREEDHRNWIRELEASVRERRDFTLARDPHQCKFGKWYDSYQPTNLELASIWSGFDLPHKRIHAIADVVTEHEKRGEFEQALAIIEQTRATALAVLVREFAAATQAVLRSNREVVVILERGADALAITVDSADVVETIQETDMMELPALLNREGAAVISRTARREQSEELLLVLDPGRLFPSPAAEPEAAALRG
jgi:chemotaxis signal transduction protein